MYLGPGTKTSARLRLMHWTGIRPSQMGRLRPEDFHLNDPIPSVMVPRGKDGRLATIPLVSDAMVASRDFLAVEACGPWSCQSANKAIRVAARKANCAPFTVYQIRHSFSTWLRRTGTDLADIQDLYGHTDAETTRLYAAPSLAKHLAAIERLRGASTPPVASKRLAVPAGSTRDDAVTH